MAIVKSMWMTGTKKKLGGTVLYKAMGQTRQRELATEISNPRTESQMTQRVKWANLVNFYRANSSWMKYAFETKKTNQSEYNKFMSVNVSGSQIYLTKQQAANGSCVLAPYVITQGSLPSIETSSSPDYVTTNIYTGLTSGILDSMTVKDFSAALVENNPAMRYGDQLSLIVMSQQTNGDTGFPFIIVRKYEVILSADNTALMTEYFPSGKVSYNTSATNSPLRFSTNEDPGGVAFILSRTVSGKTFVSSQRLVLYNMDFFSQYYSSQAQINAAIASYGQSEDAFLASTYAAENNQAPVPVSVLGLTIGTNRYYIGSRVSPFGAQGGKSISVTLSTAPDDGDVTLALEFVKGGEFVREDILESELVMNEVVATIPSTLNTYADWTLSKVIVGSGGLFFEGSFLVINSDTIGGLE